MRLACSPGSRWHRYSLTRADHGRALAVAANSAGGVALRVDGALRTTVGDFFNLGVGTYRVCHVEERIGGSVQLVAGGESSLFIRALPPIRRARARHR